MSLAPGATTRKEKELLDRLAINTIRFLSVDAVQKANSGHPGLPLGAAPMAYVLWTLFFRHNPANPQWFNRDRFVLSAGHGSMLLYSLLHLSGYELPLEQIKNFRQLGSMTPGHPERGAAPGIETTTGPLGQGFGNGVGMAIAEAYLAARYNRPGCEIVNHFTYGLVSDGDLMEGVASEAASLAGHLKLGKLIYLYDDNRITLAASTHVTFTEDRAKRFEAYGWHTRAVEDGNDLKAIDEAIREAHQESDRPSLILIRTHIGYGSPHKQDTFEAHGSPLGEEEVKLTKRRLEWPLEPAFYVPEEVEKHFRDALTLGQGAEKKWNADFVEYEKQYPELAKELRQLIAGKLPDGWDADIPQFPPDAKGMATRVASGKVMQAIYPKLPGLIGGSGDLNPSTFTALKDAGDFESPALGEGDLQGLAGGGCGYAGRNLHFGVREHAMGAILNGLATHGGFTPFGATFLTFSDYMRPPIRLAALMSAHVVYVFTHDSIGLGEDGPTHQPIEHLASLRAIPGLIVIRPCDANETAVAWRVAVETPDKPVALILTRQNVPTLDRREFAPAEGLRRGAYVLADDPGAKPGLILIASGSEVCLVVAAREALRKRGISARVVSMPSWELFEAQTKEYRDSVLPPAVRARLAVEAGVTQGWRAYVGDEGDIMGIDRFGASAPGPELMREYGFTIENVLRRADALLERVGGSPPKGAVKTAETRAAPAERNRDPEEEGERIVKENPLKKLGALGQSLWLDYIQRDLILSGKLRRMIEDDGLRGMTSNPAIFEKAIVESGDYKDDIRAMSLAGKSAKEIYEALSQSDVRKAADEFRPTHSSSGGKDGYVSLEVNPHLARDTEGAIEEARRLWVALDRPNVFIKIPATPEGLPAIRRLIAEGINVNVTLIFGLPRYRLVAEAYIAGLEDRAKEGKPLARVASVASFFLSRIDTLVDSLLDKIAAQGGPDSDLAKKARGKAAIASAKMARLIYQEIFGSDRFKRLAEKDATPQRLLWASTSTKNPEYSDVKYVEALIGQNTVNTAPLETLDAYRDHGDPKLRLQDGMDEAREALAQLSSLGINVDRVTKQLEDEGIEKFNQPFDKLMETLEKAVSQK